MTALHAPKGHETQCGSPVPVEAQRAPDSAGQGSGTAVKTSHRNPPPVGCCPVLPPSSKRGGIDNARYGAVLASVCVAAGPISGQRDC